MTTPRRSERRSPTVKEQILASLMAHGPGGHTDLALRLLGRLNLNTVRRELADMVLRDEIQVFGRQPRHGEIGRAAYVYAHPEYQPTPSEQATRAEPFIRPSSPEVEVEPPPLVFGDAALPAYALKLSLEYQILWRNGLKSNGYGLDVRHVF
jgi:hypothetical protein